MRAERLPALVPDGNALSGIDLGEDSGLRGIDKRHGGISLERHANIDKSAAIPGDFTMV
jgi:hypothetical protein